MNRSELKNFVYGQIARIGKAVSSPKRLEILDLLCQSEKSVEVLAERADISVKLVSAHLKELKSAQLVECRKQGKYVIYRISDDAIADLWITLRRTAETQLKDFPATLAQYKGDSTPLNTLDRRTLLEKAKRGEIVLLDVRPEDEFNSGHLPFAVCLPLEKIKSRLSELPRNREIVTYCKGQHCLQANEAVKLLQKQGFRASRIEQGITDWRAEGFALEKKVTLPKN